MNAVYGRDLDLNLLRVFAVVADCGSVTRAASQLYLTQPAISAALRRLTTVMGTPLFVRQGRGLALTQRGERLHHELRPHLLALIDAALAPSPFDAKTSERTLRLGLSDAIEPWLVPALLRAFEIGAPRMRLVIVPVQFRTIGDALGSRRVDAAVTVADELPPTIRRQPLFSGRFVCLFDPRHAKVGARGRVKMTERTYFEHEHVVVSYNGDLRGIIEDALGKVRKVRCSVSSFNNIGAIVDGTSLLATIPSMVAEQVVAERPHLRTAALPLPLEGTPTELFWPVALDKDDACVFLRSTILRVVKDKLRVSRTT